MRIVIWSVAGLFGLFLILVIVETIRGPKTYAELADAEAERCILHKGDGTWRASSGVSLETHCKLKATLATLAKQCREHPEGC